MASTVKLAFVLVCYMLLIWPYTNSSLSRGWATCICICITIASIVKFMPDREAYGSFSHLKLNKLPGEPLDSPPKTEWLNMGYWKDASTFPEACEALALKLIRDTNYSPGGHILDVGYGSGESIVLHMTHPLVPRPRRLAGITSLREHYKRSEVRTDRILADMPDSVPIPWLYHGDAVYHASSSARGHPLQPSAPMFTAVLALDCAYHFRTRQVFLKQALDMLKPGGRIGLADICFDFAPNGWRARLVSVLGVMPYENVVRPSDYVRMMQDMGYVDVELEDISDRVFAGFFAFLRSQGGLWPLFVGAMNMLVRWGMKFVIVSAGKPLPNS